VGRATEPSTVLPVRASSSGEPCSAATTGVSLASVDGLIHPELLTDGIVELRRWLDGDIPVARAARNGTTEEAMTWVRRQQTRPPTVGISCAIALHGQVAAGYVGLIRRPRVELGVSRDLDDGTLAFEPHQRIVGIGFWIAADRQRHGLATRAVVLISRWALNSAGVTRIEALLDPGNIASRRVVEKSGFHQEGQLRSYLELDGSYTDALAYSLLQSDL
jgi:RimJ/RimL family protein N-acetyltransferase